VHYYGTDFALRMRSDMKKEWPKLFDKGRVESVRKLGPPSNAVFLARPGVSTQRRNLMGMGARTPLTFWIGGRTPSLFATTWFQNITSPKHDVYQRSIVKGGVGNGDKFWSPPLFRPKFCPCLHPKLGLSLCSGILQADGPRYRNIGCSSRHLTHSMRSH